KPSNNVASLEVTVASALADSVKDFSGTQGQGNWYYGFYEGALPNPTFQQMTQFSGGTWFVNQNNLLTSLADEFGPPNGTTTTGGRQATEQWAVRRWVSPGAGDVTLSGILAMADASSGGNGVTGHIRLNGTEIWSRHIDAGDIVGFNYAVSVQVKPGDVI